MALKRLQREWTEKPSSYPGTIGELSNSTGFYPVPRGNVANPIDGQLLNRVASNIPASFIQVNTPYGVALGIRDGGVGNEYLEALTGNVDRRNFTLISKLRATSSSGAGVGMRTSGNDILLWRASGAFDLRIGGTDYTAGGTFNLDQFYDYSVRSNASGVAVRVDKTDVISGGVAATGNMPDILNVGVDALGGGNIYGDYLYCFIVPGFLTAQQIDDIHDNWLSYLRPRTIYYPVVAGGALLKLISETMSTSDGPTRLMNMFRLKNETQQVSESSLFAKAMKRIVDELVKYVEGDLIFPLAMTRLVGETVNTTEGIVKQISTFILKIVNETISVSESVVKSISTFILQIINETISTSEETAKFKAIIQRIAETMSISEANLIRRTLNRIIVETQSVIEAVFSARVMNRVVVETQAINEGASFRRAIVTIVSEIMQMNEGIFTKLALAASSIGVLSVKVSIRSAINMTAKITSALNVSAKVKK